MPKACRKQAFGFFRHRQSQHKRTAVRNTVTIMKVGIIFAGERYHPITLRN